MSQKTSSNKEGEVNVANNMPQHTTYVLLANYISLYWIITKILQPHHQTIMHNDNRAHQESRTKFMMQLSNQTNFKVSDTSKDLS